MEPLVFDEATHTYTVGGRPLPSVTTIIRPVSPDFSAIPPAVLERKRQLGTAVHLACELDDAGELDDDETAPELMAYVKAWRAFKSETGAQVLLNEQKLYHPSLRYAGTLDRLATLEQLGAGRWLLDIKTASELSRSYGVQLAGYAELLRVTGTEAQHRAAVQLRPDGTYRLERYRDHNDHACFMGLLALHHWKESRA